MKIGLIDMTDGEYRKHAAVAVSDLKIAKEQSWLHLWHSKFNPEREPEEQTEAMMLGTAIHCAATEPDEFPYRYEIVPEGISRRSNDGRQFFKELAAEGKQPLMPHQYEIIAGSAKAVRSQPFMRQVLAQQNCIIEQPVFWKDEKTGLICKMKPDLMLEPCRAFPNGLIVDVKSAADASPDRFVKSAFDLLYHMQAAWYVKGYEKTYRKRPPFVFLATEKQPPFAAAPYLAGEMQMLLGQITNRRLLDEYAVCVSENRWPGYHTKPALLGLPPWGVKELQDLQQTFVL